MQRKLASVLRVLEIHPIEGADFVELARINGWQCVVKKGRFRPGDHGVYFEIDAIPPDLPAFRFLWAKDSPDGSRPARYRIRSMKLRGCLSQGLLLPLDELGVPAGSPDGTDVTAQLGVDKYEPPPPTNMGDARGPFPPIAPKTDEERVQSAPEVLAELAGRPYVITLKCDGTSATFGWSPLDGSFHACGRNFSIVEGDNVYWQMARKYDLPGKLAGLAASGRRVTLQAEIVGPGIQKNRLALKGHELRVFSAWDPASARYLDDPATRELCATLDVPVVPIVESGERFAHGLESLLALAERKYPGTQNEAEGVVIRPRTEMRSAALGGRLSFKAISNRFLLKGGDDD